MKNIYLLATLILGISNVAFSQITTDYNAPNNDPIHLIDNILLGGGVVASNHSYQGDTMQIGFFNGINSNIGLDSGVVMSTGDIAVLDPNFPGFGGFVNNTVTDPDLLTVANSVPPLIGQTFTVSSINDVAVLEFDFVPTSDSLFFRYVFGSNEYLTYVNTQYNDVFGFFISGPGITGPYSAPAAFPNGSVNIATVPNSTPALPITISSVNDVLNNQYYIDNQNTNPQTVLCNGFTTVFTAKAQVQCGETYHIRLAIADGTDGALDSWVFLEAGSFTSPALSVTNSLGLTSDSITINCNSTIDLTADMNSSGATYLWNTGESTQTITAGPGSYWVQASDSANCTTFSDTIHIIGPSSASIDLGSDIDLCIGEQTYLTPTVVGGTGPFNYNWNTGQFGPTIIAGGGNYTVTVTDANGCQSSDDIVVTAHPNPVISIDPPTATVCGGVPVVLTASGADIYTWSPFVGLDMDTGSVVVTNPQSSISYTVTGTSDYGCISQEDVLINVGSAFIPIITPTNISCYGATDGIITTAINAGTAPFQYSIDGGQNFQFNNVFDQLSAGTYDVIVTDGNGCLIQEDVTINPPSPQIEVVAGGSDVACNNTSTGDVWVESIVGGLPSVTGFTYTWYSTDNNQVIGYGSTLPGVPYGGYYVVAQDSIGCVGSSSTTITESTGFTLDVITTEPICVGGQEGSAYVTVTGGGVPPYSFDWSASTNNPADTFQTLYNLIAGSYDLTITDKYGCDTTLSISINEPSLVLDVQMESIQPISCYADSTGIARAIVTGGESPYIYSWSSGHVLDTAWNLWSGTHDVLVTDIRGCTQTASVTITENTEMISDLTSTAVSCYGYSDGSAQVNTLSGGIPTYQYMWSNGHTSNTITNLSYGEYIVTTTDSTGCFVTDTVFISQPNPLQSAARVTEISCYGANDGELEAMVSGGVQSYSYQWLDGSTSLGQGSTVSNLPPSVNYQLQVTDANGCQSLAFASLSEPSEIQVLTSVVTPAYCEDVATGGISVVATGGTLENGSDYSYAWDNPGAFQQLTNNLTAQEAGDYTVTVTDDNGCVQTQTINIPLQPTFVSSTTSTATSCFNSNDASTNVITVGGYAPYTYEFTYDNGNVQTINSSNASYTQVNVPYGVYSVLIVDGNGCDISDTGFVSQPLALEYHIEKLSDQSCFGDGSLCDGKLQLGIEGGNSLYTYSWLDNQGNVLGSSTISNNNISSILTIDTIDGLCEGFHTITVTDDKNCSSTLHINSPELNPVEILEGEDVSASINMQTLSGTLLCYGDSGMSASILNPDPRFTYDWYVDGVLVLSDTLDATNLPGGQLTAVANFLGCTGTSSEVTLQQPAALNIISQQTNVSCFGDGNGSITITTQGGTGAYDYQWSTGANTSTISSLSSGVYDVTIMDANNCSLAEQFTITEPSQLQVSVTMNQNQLTGVVSGGSPSYTYEWQLNNQTVSTSSSMTAQQTGYYVLTVTDANGCVESKTQYYEQPSVDVEQNSSLDIKVYPNPASTTVTLELSSDMVKAQFKLLDTRGRVVREGKVNNKTTLNIKNLSSGMYIMEVVGEEIRARKKFLVNE